MKPCFEYVLSLHTYVLQLCSFDEHQEDYSTWLLFHIFGKGISFSNA